MSDKFGCCYACALRSTPDCDGCEDADLYELDEDFYEPDEEEGLIAYVVAKIRPSPVSVAIRRELNSELAKKPRLQPQC